MTEFIAIAVTLRAIAALFPAKSRWSSLSVLPAAGGAWLLCSSVHIAVGFYWPFAVALAAALAALAFPKHPWRTITDAAMLAVIAARAFPLPPWLFFGGLAAGWLAFGALLDLALPGLRSLWRTFLGLALFSSIVVSVTFIDFFGATGVINHAITTPLAAPFMTIEPVAKGKRVELPGDAVGFFFGGGEPGKAAVFFHGANNLGSGQASAAMIVRALRGAGFSVLAMDHPGYGKSPNPHPDTPVAGWDPLPAALGAVHKVQELTGADTVAAVGHSMGATDVFRLMAARTPLRSAGIVSASWPDARDTSDYWNGRFIKDRHISPDFPHEKAQAIRDRFYNNRNVVPGVKAGVAKILFVTFEWDHPNIIRTRKDLYDLLPDPKTWFEVPHSNHQLNSARVYRVVVGDSRVTRRLRDAFRKEL